MISNLDIMYNISDIIITKKFNLSKKGQYNLIKKIINKCKYYI